MERGVYFDAWFPRQHNYHPSLPARRLRMVEDLRAYRATVLVWSALGGGSIALRGVGKRGWMGLREFSQNRYPKLWAPLEKYFPDGLTNSDGERVTDLMAECASVDIHGEPCHALWVECPDREHYCYTMDRNNPVWREYLKAIIRIQIDAGVDGIQLDEAELPITSFQYGGCFCKDCMKGFRQYLQDLPPEQLPAELRGA